MTHFARVAFGQFSGGGPNEPNAQGTTVRLARRGSGDMSYFPLLKNTSMVFLQVSSTCLGLEGHRGHSLLRYGFCL